jgi:gliding motility-associated-like protein
VVAIGGRSADYTFAAWVQSLSSSNPARLRFSINGNVMGPVIAAIPTTCEWVLYQVSWNSGSNTTANLSLVNANTTPGGNDYALDDISFARAMLQYDSITVTVIPPPNVRTGVDEDLCPGERATLQASGAANYSWAPATGLSNPSVATPVAQPSATTEYVVTGWDMAGCVSTDTVVVKVIPPPVFAVSPVQSGKCEGDAVRLTASGADNYEWFTSTQPSLSTGSVYTFNASATDTYYVALHSATCDIRDTLSSTVVVSSRPNLVVSKSGDVNCFTREVQLSVTGADSYTWSPAEFINSTSSPNPVVNPTLSTWYVVKAVSGSCVLTDSVQVLVAYGSGGENSFYVPNAFTPNNDGKNDCFGLQHWPMVSEFEFSVYNRWGERVFYTTDTKQCWNGVYKGKLQPSGTFVYQVKTKSPCSGDKVVYLKGLVSLVR